MLKVRLGGDLILENAPHEYRKRYIAFRVCYLGKINETIALYTKIVIHLQMKNKAS